MPATNLYLKVAKTYWNARTLLKQETFDILGLEIDLNASLLMTEGKEQI